MSPYAVNFAPLPPPLILSLLYFAVRARYGTVSDLGQTGSWRLGLPFTSFLGLITHLRCQYCVQPYLHASLRLRGLVRRGECAVASSYLRPPWTAAEIALMLTKRCLRNVRSARHNVAAGIPCLAPRHWQQHGKARPTIMWQSPQACRLALSQR
jgi:hypothetical protein